MKNLVYLIFLLMTSLCFLTKADEAPLPNSTSMVEASCYSSFIIGSKETMYPGKPFIGMDDVVMCNKAFLHGEFRWKKEWNRETLSIVAVMYNQETGEDVDFIADAGKYLRHPWDNATWVMEVPYGYTLTISPVPRAVRNLEPGEEEFVWIGNIPEFTVFHYWKFNARLERIAQ